MLAIFARLSSKKIGWEVSLQKACKKLNLLDMKEANTNNCKSRWSCLFHKYGVVEIGDSICFQALNDINVLWNYLGTEVRLQTLGCAYL